MAKTKKISRVIAFVLTLVMMLTIVPFQGLAAEAADPTAVELQNGKVAISNDMTDEQIKEALFNALVKNPEGKNAQDYEWEYYCEGKNTEVYKYWDWVTIKGEVQYTKPSGIIWEEDYHFPALKDNGNGNWQVRLAGTTAEVTLEKVSSCNVTFNYDETQGTVYDADGITEKKGTFTGVSPKAGMLFTVTPTTGYKVDKVTVNGKALEAVDGKYEFVPVADTTVEVAFEEAVKFNNITLNPADGVSFKVNSYDANDGVFQVAEDTAAALEFITDANTSISKVVVDGIDVTSDVVFNNYNGTYTIDSVSADTEVTVTAVKSEVVLSGETVIPVVADENGKWDYVQIREAIIDTLVSKDSTIGNFDRSKLEVKYNCKTTSPDVWVDLGYDSGWAWEWTFEELFKYTGTMGTPPMAAQIRLCYTGDGQYRPTEYVYETITIDDLKGSSIAVRSGVQEFELAETATGGVYNYEALRQAIYNAVIDEVHSYPEGAVTYDNIKLTYKILDAMGSSTGIGAGEFYDFEQGKLGADVAGTYKYLYKGGQFTIKAELPSTESYYGTSVEFDVKVTPVALPTAEIAVKEGYDKNFELTQNYDRSFNYETFEEAIYNEVIDMAASKFVTRENIKFAYNITADGTYTVKAYVDNAETYYGAEVTFEVVVDVIDNYTAKITVDEANNSFDLVETGINTYDYASLKQAIVDQMFTVTGLPEGVEVTADNFDFMYVIYNDGMLVKDYINFEERQHASDTEEILYNYLHEGGTFECWAELGDKTGEYYGAEVYFTINVTPVNLGKTSILAKDGATVTLNINKDRSYDYAGLKQAMLDEIFTITGLPEGVELTAGDLEFLFRIYNDGAAIQSWVPFETRQYMSDTDEILYHYLYQGGEFDFYVKLPDGENYYGSEVYFKANVEVNDEFTTKIALKDNYQKDFTLYYNADQSFDYERLHRELFDAVIDTANSSANVTFENTVVTYDVTDGMLIHYPDSPLNTVGSDVADPDETLFTYLHEGGTFTVKFAVPNSAGLFGNSVSVSLTINPYKRAKTSIVLNGNAVMDYVASPDAIKQYIFDSVISKELSILPEGVTVDDFTFEYWAKNYTAGGLPGVEENWVPFEGMQHPTLAGSYYKAIGAGDHYFRVRYNGSATDEPSAWTSGKEIISLPKADFDISLKQDYIYRGDELPKDFIQVSENAKGADINYRMLFTTTTNAGNALVYLQTRDGYSRSDFDLWMNPVITDVFGADWNAMAVLNNGLTIDQYKQLINSERLYEHFNYWYGMDEADMAVFRETALSRLGGMNHVEFRIGTPKHAAHYDLFVGAYNESFNTEAIHTGMYVKYNSRGNKLIWREDPSGLNTITSKTFDFGADVTVNGISQSDGNVLYLYTGLFYCSTQPPRGKSGWFIQTAWTKVGTTYCFPQTRSFTISVL